VINLPETPLEIDGVVRLADIVMSLQRCFVLRLTAELSSGQVSFPQFFLLSHISTQETMSMSEIAEKMNHSTAAATGLVDRLEKLAYVHRSNAATDRRKVLVRITPKGVKLVELIRQDMVERLTHVMEILTPEEQHMWLQIYNKIFDYCQSNPADSGE